METQVSICKGKWSRISQNCKACSALIYDDLFTNPSIHLAKNLPISFSIVFLSFHVRMFHCKQHRIYTSQHITRAVSTTVYGVYVFWLQGIYTWQSFATPVFTPGFDGVRVLQHCSFSVLCFFVLFVFVHVYLMLPIFLVCPFGFL